MLDELIKMSHKYGSDPDYVLAGGGNTSFKDRDTLYIKGSGTSLSTITEDGFVKMDRALLKEMMKKSYPASSAEREADVLYDMSRARLRGEEGKRPSVETLLHDLFKESLVLHVHPALVNGLTCGRDGEEASRKLFPNAVWVPASDPGFTLACLCKKKMDEYEKIHSKNAKVLLLQNHGVFFAADTLEEMDSLVSSVMDKLKKKVRLPELNEEKGDEEKAVSVLPVLRALAGEGGDKCGFAVISSDAVSLSFAKDKEAFRAVERPFTPDHIVYCKARWLYLEKTDREYVVAKWNAFREKNGYSPRVVLIKGVGAVGCGDTYKIASTSLAVARDAMKIARASLSFGGPQPMTPAKEKFIINWEVESYRSKVSLGSGTGLRLGGKIAVVTGSAQGFGKGIAESLLENGAYVVIADMNYDGAREVADTFCEKYGKGRAVACSVNVADEESVREMIDLTVKTYGGLDLFVSNAGIAKAGGLEEMQKKTFELVTSVNYTGFFLGAKYASRVMKIQREVKPGCTADIVQVNSKSGLEGSKNNFAYAGSKFGGIGLVQSFALELCPFGIKVNAVCPGNYLDGPLWSDPEKGLFVQYLKAGKVPGAKNVADVRAYYMSKVPMNRGCLPSDVARAICYLVEQQYETGQALPVTGGQVMLS